MPDDSSPDADADADGDGASGVAVDGLTDGDAQASVRIDGTDAPLHLSDDIVDAVERQDDVSLDDIARAAAPPGQSDFSLNAQTDAGDTVTVPVKDVRDYDLTSARWSNANRFQFIGDDRIQKLEENSVTYTERVGDWILSKDDLVPAIKERLKALILGEGGLSVDPADPGSDADQRLADHLDELFESDVQPTKVIDTILEQNMKNSRAVVRSTDLDPLDLDHLAYFRDGVTGEEIYWQSDVRVHTFDVEEADDDVGGIADIGLEEVDIDGQPLVIGDHVFDVSLYDKPPLEAVADTVVNKKQMQRLKARKAEITSFGGIYVKVNPPEYLPEDEYFDRVEDDDGEQVTKLERALEQNLDAAFDWAKGYQSGTTGSVPMHWSVEQVEIPEGDQPLDDQIRGYNKDISRRLLVPIDIIELREGSELSRETLMQTLLTTIQGWRQEIIRVFEQFASVQADIHDLNGDVEFSFPPLNDANVDAIMKLLQFAGVLGATSDELRQMVNQVQGVELDTDDGGTPDPMDDAPAGGPQDPDQRTDQMRDFLDDQNRRGSTPDQDADQADDQPDVPAGTAQAAPPGVPDDAVKFGNLGGDPFADEEMLNVFVEALFDVGADQVWLGDEPWGDHSGIHDRPVYASGMSMDDAETVWEVFENDAQALTGPSGDADALQAAGAFEATIFRVVAPEDRADDFEDPFLGIGVDFQNHDVYVDWRNEVFPDELDNPHVSIYGSIEDLEQATGNTVEPIEQVSIDAAKAMVPDDTLDAMQAAASFSEGQKVETPDGQEGVVVEVRTSNFTGPDGDDVEASEDNPAYLVGTVDGAEVFRGGDLTDSDWGTDQDDPASDLADQAEAMVADLQAAIPDDHDPVTDGTLKAGPTDWDYPDSWTKSDVPARLILLDAWSSMGGQFDCPSGDCCKGTMLKNGMSERGANQFCASMKDRVLMWEGWRRGGASRIDATLHAAHAFQGPASIREAAQQVQRVVQDQLDDGQDVKLVDRDGDTFQVIVHDAVGDIVGSMSVTQSSLDPNQYLVTGTEDFFRNIGGFHDQDLLMDDNRASLSARIRAFVGKLTT